MTDIIMAAGEASGDRLGGALAAKLKSLEPSLSIAGVGGEKMKAAGVEVLFSHEPLSVMGYWDALTRLPSILSVRRQLIEEVLRLRPRLFIGIDAPDFNLGVEKELRRAGIKTAHYVSPSVWMWRKNRISNIAESADAMWCLFPFEPECYKNTSIDARFVGHPDAKAESPDKVEARKRFRARDDEELLALMPGSRAAELRIHLPLFAGIMRRIQTPQRRFIAVAATQSAAEQMKQTLPWIEVYEGNAADVLEAADGALVKSGTSSLQAAFAETPMVVVYKTSLAAHYAGVWRRFELPYFSLPNIMSGKFVVPELLQGEARAADIATQTVRILEDDNIRNSQIKAFKDIRRRLFCNGADTVASAAVEML